MQSSFAWDWGYEINLNAIHSLPIQGPSFPTQGIWQPILIEAYDDAILQSVSPMTIFDSKTKQWLLNVTIWFEGYPKSTVKGRLMIDLDGISLLNQDFNLLIDANGDGSLRTIIVMPKTIPIQPWYPNGLGPQKLYQMKIVFQSANDSSNLKKLIGFRTIELVQDKLNTSREAYSFYFKINGVPIYSKGSNWIPAHALHEKLSSNYLEFLLWSAKEANMNMLRVWGGGIYETDHFYEIADRYGILIWQDMMFACALYPTDRNFLQSISTEIRQQIRRLSHHPSIVIWAGNNENEAAIAQSWWPEIFQHLDLFRRDYLQLYIETIKSIVEQEDSSRPYVSSSPSNGVISKRENYLSSNPQSNQYGDVHFYTVSGDVWDWRVAPSAKFVSEYGFQSLPSFSLLEKYLNKDYLKYPFNDGMRHREHQAGGIELITSMMSNYLPLPKQDSIPSRYQLDDFIYLSQIHQSMAIKSQTEFYRRNRKIDKNSGEGLTLGALYWQLNSIWPSFSWSSIEFGGQWKMVHYYVKKIFDNLLVDVFEQNNHLMVMIVRDDHSHFVNFSVTISVYGWRKQEPLNVYSTFCMTHSFDVALAFQRDLNQLMKESNCLSKDSCFVSAKIAGVLDREFLVRENFKLLGNLKRASLIKNPNIHLDSIQGPIFSFDNYIYDIKLSSDHIVPFVWLEFVSNSDIFAIFSDNGFLMIRNATIRMIAPKNYPKEKIISNLAIKIFNDVYHKYK
ncbi:Beta-mannosidase-like protein [Sarcoptes scabiei]|uniref:beta-mannosidase n=1 Tax=Sarcoptes scabiei TaxID=52283 RepID=A0A132AM62_SARSC|nr:Beta-mannosidase-like protein [Sarcoptes scabiei]